MFRLRPLALGIATAVAIAWPAGPGLAQDSPAAGPPGPDAPASPAPGPADAPGTLAGDGPPAPGVPTSSPPPGDPTLPRVSQEAPTTAEAAREEARPEPDTRYLARALGLQDSPVTVYGWIQNSFTGTPGFSPKDRLTVTVFPNRLANEWQGNQYYLVLEDPLELDSEANLGFRLDTLFGNDWLFSRSLGLFDGAFTYLGFPGVDFPQVYGEVHLPILFRNGVDLRGGRFYSPAGYESVMAVNRPLLSVPYIFNFTPFTFLGALATFRVTDRLNLYNGAVNGADRWVNLNLHYSYLGGVNWTSPSEKSTFSSFLLVGPNQFPFFPSTDLATIPSLPVGVFTTPEIQDRRNPFYTRSTLVYISALLTRKWDEKLTQAAEVAYVTEGNVLGLGPRGGLARGEYYGFCHWLLYEFDPKFTGVFRAEVFRDDDGLALGIADTFSELTLGAIYKPKPHFWIRPEIRYDQARSTTPYDDGTRSGQVTLAFDVILRF